MARIRTRGVGDQRHVTKSLWFRACDGLTVGMIADMIRGTVVVTTGGAGKRVQERVLEIHCSAGHVVVSRGCFQGQDES